MKVLVACEFSGIVREAFAARGHVAMSCDLLDTERDGYHFKGDVLSVIDQGWDLMIAHPPCTYLTVDAEWAYRDNQTKKMKPGTLVGQARRDARDKAIEFVMALSNAPIDKIAIENPIGVLSTRWREPDQFIQPYEYEEDASKSTCLWLKNLPRLSPVSLFPPRLAGSPCGRRYLFRWSNQTETGQNKEIPSDDRWKIRSRTYQGIANAMASQWG
jgi:hypothetical protein